jgi:hypothetical protein
METSNIPGIFRRRFQNSWRLIVYFILLQITDLFGGLSQQCFLNVGPPPSKLPRDKQYSMSVSQDAFCIVLPSYRNYQIVNNELIHGLGQTVSFSVPIVLLNHLY